MTSQAPVNEGLNDKQVIAFLKQNPDFLNKNPKLLQALTPPSDDKGRGVVDFQQFMLERLKTDKKDAVDRQREIIAMSRSNMNTQARVHACVVRLLDARTFADFVETITHEIGVILDVDIVTLIIEATGKDIPHVQMNGVRVVEKGVIDHFLGGKDSHLEGNCKGHEIIFGGGAGLVKSQALLNLKISPITPNGMVAFGSRDPNAFIDGQATDLVGFLADVIERMMRHWLELP